MAGTPNMTSSAATRPPPILRHSICAITPFRLLASMTRICSRSEEHTSELQSPCNLVCRLLLEKKKKQNNRLTIKEPLYITAINLTTHLFCLFVILIDSLMTSYHLRSSRVTVEVSLSYVRPPRS